MSEKAHNTVDLVVSIVLSILLFGGMFIIPRDYILFWLIPIGVIWIRFNQVMLRRERDGRF